MMLDALDSDGLQLRKEPGATKACVISKRSFVARRGVRVRVWIGAGKRRQPPCPVGGPADFEKLKLSEANEQLRILADQIRVRDDMIARSRARQQTAKQKEAALEAELLRVENILRLSEQRAADLQARLRHAHSTIERQERKLATASTDAEHLIYRRVGLDKNCPDFVLSAVKKAYARELHPDLRRPDDRSEAENRLKEANAVFDKISELRNRE
jgi:hypothetical protein